MSRNKRCFSRTALYIVIGIAFLNGLLTTPALAHEDPPPNDSSCITCHENQYLLYDSGKWYCLCKSPVLCTECHGGRTDTMVEDLAHEGMIADPIANKAVVCQSCHADDYQTRVEKFTSIAGIHATSRSCPTYEPVAQIVQPPDNGEGTRWLRALPSGAWQVAGTGFLGLSFLIVFLYTCRCWKIEQSSKFKE